MEVDLPQLEVAGDPEQMREIFQRHLRPLDGRAYRIRECRIFHTRYREGLRYSRQYDLRLEEPDTGREQSQWVTATTYAGGRTRQVWKKLQRSNPEREVPGALSVFAPFSYIPELDMLVQVFPYDRRLSALPLLMSGPPAELEPLLLAGFGPGDWRTEEWDAEPVRYVAEKRATLRLTARARDAMAGRAEERRFYAKVYHDEEAGKQTHEILQALWDRTSEGDAGFAVGRPVAYLSDLRTLLQEEVSGTSFKDVLLRGDRAIPAGRKVARALASLHLERVVPPRRRRLSDEVAALKRTGESLQHSCPPLKAEIEEVVGAIVAGLVEVPPAPTHGDPKLNHFMLDGDRVALLDLDKFIGADPIIDVARILVPLSKVPLRSSLPQGRESAVARAFVEEYFSHVPQTWHARLPFHYASALLRRSAGLPKNQSPEWHDKIEALLDEARASLSGRIW